ncbi:ATP-dependent DNA helicase [Tepidimicrobium xylanilyticum]|uniref:Rad3-related DNA helicase n=1 Tax=Tepidimicrobium xylanilyticum TaxID=1123352 RepID=A0A1H3C034_9FIRM|nr:ATP-dependent DNA helicase [Tepidimicrobium xylanilyticum]SDX47430.1 Rad3-related DNA helicase [Tepidimicrobium xylanilyticum]
MSKRIKVSVRNLVEFVLRSGDIDNTFVGSTRAVEGTRAHQKVQSSYGAEYTPEVVLSHVLSFEDFTLEVEGRVDGIIRIDEYIIIDEIKSTVRSLEDIEEDYNPLHWAQGKCYGYIYAKGNRLDELQVQLTYFNIESEETKKFIKSYTFQELEEFFLGLIEKYVEWASIVYYWQKVRNESIKELSFPFKSYRKGQRKLAVAVYETVLNGKNLFVQAPTGIGKTISTIFPSIKAIGEGIASKVFYLTAKTITREAALNSIKQMIWKGLRIKSIVITAKEKVCLNQEVKCNPKDCPYAKGHFDRVNKAIMDLLNNEDMITREIVEKYAEYYKVCPFEFSLDLSLWSDVIICDYNYVFDPNVSLKRFFEGNGDDYIFLIDEAHNLVDRSRDMFSVEIMKEPFLKYKRLFKEEFPNISKAFNNCNNVMNRIKRKYLSIENYYYQKEEIIDLYSPITKLIKELEEWLINQKGHKLYEEAQELYFQLLRFVKIADLYDKRYVTYIELIGKDLLLKLFCVDPSNLLSEILKKGKAAIFFSATLTPLDYYRDVLGGNEEDYIIRFSSPFPKDNLCVLVGDNISTKYKDRDKTYSKAVEYIEEFVLQKEGNYFVFFPSYKYMEQIYQCFIDRNPDIKTIIQESSMSEKEREEFLDRFNHENEGTMVAFAVLGGIFSEGIDLIGDKLIGAVIVGVGLPQICFERDIIREYFQSLNGLGYEYAYMYPGMNKVLQAAGRVIRSETDKGAILLIDDRFGTIKYKRLYPREWFHYERVGNSESIRAKLMEFWSL